MPVTASEVFDFLESHDSGLIIHRTEIASESFGSLRRSLRQIILILRDSDDDAQEVSQRVRALLSEWLTVPVPFSLIRDALISALGTSESVGVRWGSDVHTLYDSALRAAEELFLSENPVRQRLRDVLQESRSHGGRFKIFCHRRARPHFESLYPLSAGTPFGDGTFLHSVSEYLNAELFDVLIKVGPLRSGGWGSAPDALLTSPRFASLVQLVWSGCRDEQDFGYDPAARPDTLAGAQENASTTARTRAGPITWTARIARVGEDSGAVAGGAGEIDELREFRELDRRHEDRLATLVQVDSDLGILYASHSQVLSFDPDPRARQPIDRRIPGGTLVAGMYVIQPVIEDVDLGAMHAGQGQYSRIWKEQLTQLWRVDAVDLLKRLLTEGLDLDDPGAAVERWCRPPTTVIHAPQTIEHFQILMRVLGHTDANEVTVGSRRLPFWRLAWNEIRRSRGEAIQAGVQEHEIVEQALHAILQSLLPEVREKSGSTMNFMVKIPSTHELKGVFEFFTVGCIEEGFRVPDSELRRVLPLTIIDSWRN
jgi:hypothetical protein